MIEGLSDTALLRIGIAVAALVLFVVILVTARRRPGKRMAERDADDGVADDAGTGDGTRVEPTLREIIESGEGQDAGMDGDAVAASRATAPPAASPTPQPGSQLGARPSPDYDKIVSVYLVARAGRTLSGPDLVVAAEKAGLVYGHMNIFHRLVDQHHELGPIFSVANLVKPGFFDLRAIKELETPGVNFFIALPGPLSALDAWDTLLPTAQRMAELLDAVLLDEERNALGRQRIANIRDELRAYDRAREKATIHPGR
jgi:cell division protein ZipA